MKELCLTIFELLYLGNLIGKYLHAVPNVYAELSEEDASEAKRVAMDALLKKGFVKMNFDGDITITEPVSEFVRLCADCDGYVLISRSGADAGHSETVIWRKQNTFMQATLIGMDYVLTLTTVAPVIDQISHLWLHTYPEAGRSESVKITQFVLKKAKRLLLQDTYDAAEQLLIQNRVEPGLSQIVLDALSGASDFYSLLFVDMGDSAAISSSFIFAAGRFGCLQMCPVVENYRSAAVFTLVSPKELKASIRAETLKFVLAESTEV